MTLFRIGGRNIEAISLPASGEIPLDGVARLFLAGGKPCMLFASPGVAVNGLAALPAVVLAERDEIQAGGQKYVLAAENAPAVELVAGDSRTCCTLCASLLTERRIHCPSCHSAFHEECWDYAPRCAGCGREIAGEWRPE